MIITYCSLVLTVCGPYPTRGVVVVSLHCKQSQARTWLRSFFVFLGVNEDAEHWQGSVKVLHAKASELQAAGDLQGALDFYQRPFGRNMAGGCGVAFFCFPRAFLF